MSGLFNFDDKIVLAVPFLIHIRQLLARGTALHNILLSWANSISALYDAIITHHTIPKFKQAYLAFEALSEHGEESECLLLQVHSSSMETRSLYSKSQVPW